MTESTDSDFTVPSNPADRLKIKNAIFEICGAMQFIEDKRSFIKDVIADLHEKFAIPKKVVAKMAKTYHNDDYTDVLSESSAFETAYDIIMTEQAKPPHVDADDTIEE